MTMFQIQGASEDPVTRYLAFWSLICALLSLLFGCLFIIRFGSMRVAHKAAEWALVSLIYGDFCIKESHGQLGSPKITVRNMECVGYVGDASHLACLVRVLDLSPRSFPVFDKSNLFKGQLSRT